MQFQKYLILSSNTNNKTLILLPLDLSLEVELAKILLQTSHKQDIWLSQGWIFLDFFNLENPIRCKGQAKNFKSAG